MRRAVAILKYIPAVLCGLLVVAWVVSLYASFGVDIDTPFDILSQGSKSVSILQGIVYLWHDPYGSVPRRFLWEVPDPLVTHEWFGDLHIGPWRSSLGGPEHYYIAFPLALVLTTLVPIAVGCLIRFRFPLWSYFVYTALVAAELAYYLR